MNMRIREMCKSIVNFFRVYKKNKAALISLLYIIFISILALFAKTISPYSPFKTMVAKPFEQPSFRHPMGVDFVGRDIFSRVLSGASVSLSIGFIAAIISAFIGTVVGSIAGYYGGIVDELLMRITEFFMVIPGFFFAIVLVALFGNNILNIIIVIGITYWTGTARLVRAEFLRIRDLDYVVAAHAMGYSSWNIIFDEILPNAFFPIIVNGSFMVAFAILTEAGLSYLGLGDPNVASWGLMLNEARRYMGLSWSMSVFPGLAICLTTLAFNIAGDGLNDALNPRISRT